MPQYLQKLNDLVMTMPRITLDEMSGVKLLKRTDTKFVTNVAMLEKLLKMAQGSYYAQEVNGRRILPYDTVYFDDPKDHVMFRQHHCGHIPRTKVRVRTYAATGHTFFEIKRKNNHGKTKKKRIEVPSQMAVLRDRAGEDFLREITGFDFDFIIPTMSTHFWRVTLVNTAKTERLTIDFGLHFHNYETKNDAAMDEVVIIELKRDGRVPSPILEMLRQLRIKPAGFSKYCMGSCVTNPGLRQNRFKQRLRRVDKIAAKLPE